MLTEICAYLKNWFDRKPDGVELPKFRGEFTISGGTISGVYDFVDGQYFRIVGSLLNDGVYEYRPVISGLVDETFDGALWSMSVPRDVIDLDARMIEWVKKYESADSPAMSPYNSESFGGYSYSKKAGGGGTSGSGGVWDAFAPYLVRYKKL